MSTIKSKDGTSIAFDRIGHGHPIIMVDGAFCSRSLGPMTKLSAALAQHFTIFTYDRRGRGDSGDTKPYAVEREIEDIEALIREAGGSAFVFGLSSGAALSIQAVAHGLPIKKLALYEPPFNSDHGKLANQDTHLAQLISLGRRGDAVRFYMKGMSVPPMIVAVMRMLPLWTKLKAVANTLPYDAAILGDFSIPTEKATSITIPTIVIGGDKSPPVLSNAVRAIADVIPNAKHHMLKGQNHNVSTKALAPVLEMFFKSTN